VARAAGLAGRYLVLVGDVHRTVVVPDPVTALGVHLLEGGAGGAGAGLVSHARLAPGRSAPVPPGEVLVVGRRSGGSGLAPRPLATVVDLASLVCPGGAGTSGPGPVDPAAATRAGRLARHADVVRRRGSPWLALDGGTASATLLPHVASAGGGAV